MFPSESQKSIQCYMYHASWLSQQWITIILLPSPTIRYHNDVYTPGKYMALSKDPSFHCRNVPSTIVSDMLAQYLPVIPHSIIAKYTVRNITVTRGH